MQTSTEMIGILITVIVQALYIAFKIGKMEEKLEQLEHKQDKHNSLIERMVKVESNIKAIWHNLEDNE